MLLQVVVWLKVESSAALSALARKIEHGSVAFKPPNKAKCLRTDAARFWCLFACGFFTYFNTQKTLNGY